MVESADDQEREPWDMPKFPSLKYPNHESVDQLLVDDTEVMVEEKLDGANFRFRWTEDGVVYGSRRVLFHEDGEPLPIDEVTDAFRHAVEYVELVADFDALDEPGRYAFYGEAMHTHSIDYDAWDGREPDPEDDTYPNVFLFDVYDCELETWVGRDMFHMLAMTLGMEPAPRVDRVSAEELSDDGFDIPQSVFREPDESAELEFDQEGLAEGVVLRNLATGQTAKLVDPEFKENKHGGPSSTGSPDEFGDGGRFVDTYITDARIEKTIHKLVDEGKYDGMKMEMMQDLPKRVLVDAVQENAWELLTNNLELDEDAKGDIRSKASSRCASKLKREMQSL